MEEGQEPEVEEEEKEKAARDKVALHRTSSDEYFSDMSDGAESNGDDDLHRPRLTSVVSPSLSPTPTPLPSGTTGLLCSPTTSKTSSSTVSPQKSTRPARPFLHGSRPLGGSWFHDC